MMQRFERLGFHLEKIEGIASTGFGEELLSIGEAETPGLMNAATTDRIAGHDRCTVKRPIGGVQNLLQLLIHPQ